MKTLKVAPVIAFGFVFSMAFAQGPADPQALPPDEAGRAVARLGILNGDASIRRGDSQDWHAAAVNAPIMTGDELSVAAGGRAEVQIDAAHFVRFAGDTEARFADIENGHYQIQVGHGLVTWRVLRNSQAQAEIDTPLVAVHPAAQSSVRIDVSADGTTTVTVRRGEASASTQRGSERIAAGSSMLVRGSANDPEFQVTAAASRDEWDNWSDQRDTYLTRAQSPRYVTEEVSGAEDLDAYGRWVYDAPYGWVWSPTVAASWAPYRDGRWVWEDYYGWTWVDYAPWGWAPFHYGSWYFRTGFGWAWFPGPRIGHVWWRPAMVSFFGWGPGFGVGFGFGNIGWIPLAPFEVFHPWYGRGFYGRSFIAGGVVGLRNASVIGGVTAVTALNFRNGNFRNTVAVDHATLQGASALHGSVSVTPTASNLHFAERGAVAQTPRGVGSTAFAGTPAAAAARTPFAQQQSNVRSAMPGRAGVANAPGNSAAQSPNRGPAANPASNPAWQRFQGVPPSAAAGQRAVNPGAASSAARPNPTPGFQRFDGANAPPANPSAGRAQAPAAQTAPRQFQVSPPIMQNRQAAPAPAQAPPAYRAAPAPAAPPAVRSAAPARSAPAPRAGNSAGGHGGGRR